MNSVWDAAPGYLTSSSGLSVALYWWFCLLIPGLLALPLTARLSARQLDGAYPLAKVLGLVLPAYAVWLLSSLHVAPFARGTVFAAVAALGVFAAILFWKDRAVLRATISWRVVLLEEVMFLLVLTGFGLLRYIRPDLTDIEKYMNFAFVNASLRTATMPPIDPWYALEPMNYYYFGHFLTAYEIKLGGFVPAIGYNLMFVTLPAMAFVLTFSIVANAVVVFEREAAAAWQGRLALASPGNPALDRPAPRKSRRAQRKEEETTAGQMPMGPMGKLPKPITFRWLWAPIASGLVSAVMIVGGGSLHTVVYGMVQPFLGAQAHPRQAAILSSGMQNPRPYIWSDPRSYIGYNPETNDKAITEFPAYAFILGDLHAHVINLVLVLSLLLLLLFFFCRSDEIGGRSRSLLPSSSSPAGAAAGRLVEGLPFLLCAALLLGLFVLTNTWDFPIYYALTATVILLRCLRDHGEWMWRLSVAGVQCVLVAAMALGVAWPFLHHFHPSAKEICPVTTRSPLWQLAILWGQQAVMMALFAAAVGWLWWKGRKEYRRLNAADTFFSLCLLMAGGCIALPEFLYFKDVFEERWPRAITMFKFSFQAYALTAVASGYIACRLVRLVRVGELRWLTMAGLGIWMGLLLEFFNFAVPGYYLSQPGSPGLDGLGYLKSQYPEDAAIIDFLNRQTFPGNVLEATGDPYTHCARISVATGRPTILGWWLHEQLWRNEPNSDPIGVRRQAVLDIYGPADMARTRQLLEAYDIRYIVLAPQERKEMPQLNESKLRSLARSIFKHGEGEVLEFVSTKDAKPNER